MLWTTCPCTTRTGRRTTPLGSTTLRTGFGRLGLLILFLPKKSGKIFMSLFLSHCLFSVYLPVYHEDREEDHATGLDDTFLGFKSSEEIGFSNDSKMLNQISEQSLV